MPSLMMRPCDLGLPERFAEFRDAQAEAIEYTLTSDKRFIALGLPTGSGKSPAGVAIAKLLGGRAVILTSTIALEEQYLRDFSTIGMSSIRGRSNYPCWEGGNCEEGARLGCVDKLGCPYMGAFRVQQESELVVTNYSYWLATHKYGQGIKKPDTLICDEAGLASEWLSRSLDFHIGERECRDAGVQDRPDYPDSESCSEWGAKGPSIERVAKRQLEELKYSIKSARGYALDKLKRQLRHAESFLDRARSLSQIDDGNWVVTHEEGNDDGRRWKFECVWPGKYRERLFQGVERVILMSGTLRPKTLSLLGIAAKDADFKEWGRQFPAANGPVIWLPTVRVNARMDHADVDRWLTRIDDILDARADRKGIIQTVSYARAKQIKDMLPATAHQIILNGSADPDAKDAREAFEKHSKSTKPTVLCSPSFSTGWDFAGKLAEFQIIAKIPLPDTRSKVMQARLERDKSYADYLAAQELVQACGRVVRGADDRGESIVIDDSWSWFRTKASDHFPRWFKVRREDELPPALPKL